jgi:hypothetical protein
MASDRHSNLIQLVPAPLQLRGDRRRLSQCERVQRRDDAQIQQLAGDVSVDFVRPVAQCVAGIRDLDCNGQAASAVPVCSIGAVSLMLGQCFRVASD